MKSDDVTMQLQALDDGVYACLQPDRGFGWSNSGLVARGGGLVVDTFWDLPRTRAMIDMYAGVHPALPRRLVNTHHNGDHCWGNQLFAGAEILGHRLCAEGMREDIAPATMTELGAVHAPRLGLHRFAKALADYDFRDITITPPTTTFEGDVTLDLDGLRVDILYVGPAHTAGDAVVHLPERGILFGGDVLWNSCTPIGWEGTYAQWYAALDRIIALAPRIVVPGHGGIMDTEGVKTLRRYFEFVQAESKRFFEAGLDEMEACKRIDLGPYAKWTEPSRIVFNVRRAYRELRGEPYDAPLDVIALLTDFERLGDWYDAKSKGGG
jgi:glyoxylase-like metal-dependent hydrolase (beta-lactamase superfamily II)